MMGRRRVNEASATVMAFRSTKLKWIRLKQALQKSIESCSNGIPKPVRDALDKGKDAYVAFCASRTDEAGRQIDVKLQGKVLLVARVRFCFHRRDCEGDSRWARECKALLAANPSSQEKMPEAPHDSDGKQLKEVREFKYNSFMALDMGALKVIPDPGLAIPAEPAWQAKRAAGWSYSPAVLQPWIENALGGLPRAA